MLPSAKKYLKESIVIIGGGAAGFFCAINLAMRTNRYQIILLEKTGKLLSKVKVSGGGRCNVTHHNFNNTEIVKYYPRGEKFLKNVFHKFSVTDTIEWFESHGVKLKAEADNRMFPVTDSSQTVIDCLLNLAAKYHIDIRMNAEVKTISCDKQQGFVLELKSGTQLKASKICIATGGYNKLEAYNYIGELEHEIIKPVPSLFTFNLPEHNIRHLQGVSIEDVSIKIMGSKLQQRGPLLITHWGLSGPVVLRLSAWGARVLAESNWHFSIIVNWLPRYNEETLRDYFFELRIEKAKLFLHHKNPFGLPSRLWQYFLHQNEIGEQVRWSELPAKEQNKLISTLCAQVFEVKGKTTFKEEFVTAGGISLREIDTQTMMSRKVPNLLFAGEIIDVDGVTGGFNFQNAWSTAYVAAVSMSME